MTHLTREEQADIAELRDIMFGVMDVSLYYPKGGVVGGRRPSGVVITTEKRRRTFIATKTDEEEFVFVAPIDLLQIRVPDLKTVVTIVKMEA